MLETEAAVLVTVNRRLARYLKSLYDARRLAEGRLAWETPNILPYAGFLEKCFDEAGFSQMTAGDASPPLLLSPEQERRLWEQVIGRWGRSREEGLLQGPETAGQVQEAWELCKEWRISRHELALAPSGETEAFLAWGDRFARICKENNWLDRAGLADAVMEGLGRGLVPSPSGLILAGFDALSPRQTAMAGLLESIGCRVWALIGPQAEPSRIGKMAYPDREAEMAAAAAWAGNLLARQTSAPVSEFRVGIVAPDLENRREALTRHLEDALHPSLAFKPDGGGPRSFNISLGAPLVLTPIAAAALGILALAYRSLDAAEYGALLRSPHLAAGETELSRRSLMDAGLREAREPAVDLRVLLRYSQGRWPAAPLIGACPTLANALLSLREIVDALPRTASPSFWAERFQAMLKAMGWPGERPLSSDEYQAVSAWHEVLKRFSFLDMVIDPMAVEEAAAVLSRLLGETLFQPESGDAPIQVLGILEAAGESFSHLWVMGLDGDTWPPAARPNPFLPASLQRRLGLPHGSAEREAAYAGRLLDRLLASSTEIILSHPLMDGDTELSESPLIAAIPPMPALASPPGFRERIFTARILETLEDSMGPAANEDGHLPGGVSLLKAQAICPFSAFAAYRLGARPLETPAPGLDARKRGQLVHHALDVFWGDVQTQAALNALSRELLEQKALAAVRVAVGEAAKQHPRVFTPIFTRIETERLFSLMLEWLALEAHRPDFAVSSHEKRLECAAGGIRLSTRVDRIDQLGDGRLLIIDYKTGDPRLSDWFTSRIVEPQLPLYSLTVGDPVAGVMFGRVRKGNVTFLGMAEAHAAWRGIKTPGDQPRSDGVPFSGMGEILMFWREHIDSLAREAGKGVAAVAPMDPKTSCRRCALGLLCRVQETGVFWEVEAETEPEASSKTEGAP